MFLKVEDCAHSSEVKEFEVGSVHIVLEPLGHPDVPKAPPPALLGRSTKEIIVWVKNKGLVSLKRWEYVRPVERGPAHTRLTRISG